MKITVDTEKKTLSLDQAGQTQEMELYSRRAFELISDVWLKVGWDQKYSYTFTWLGRPIIQLPEDLVRVQEVICSVKPDVIIETGVAHGGSLVFYATLCKALGKGRVIGIDIHIRPHNRKAIEAHLLAPYITLTEGSSIAPETVSRVKQLVRPGETVLVLLDSCHTKAHVAGELDAYYDLVTVGSYIVATDGVMQDLSDLERGSPDWTWNNPASAAIEFAKAHANFVIEQPIWRFNESVLDKNITYLPSAFLKRVS